MSNEYRHSFIDSLILGNFYIVEEFDDFQATVIEYSILPFTHMNSKTWKLLFYIDENDKLGWKTTEMDGIVQVIIKDTPSSFETFGLFDENASDFIECLFPIHTIVEQISPNSNIFLINKNLYNFDTMTVNDNEGYIHFEFKL